MDIPKVISLLSTQGDRAGVMLLAPDHTGARGDCVFMLSPSSIAGVDSDMGVVVSELKVSGEHRFQATVLDSAVTLVVLPVDLPKLELRLNDNFTGSVLTDFGGVTRCIGSAEPLPSSA